MALGNWLKGLAVFIVVPAVGGLCLFILANSMTATPEDGTTGWPLTYATPIS
jgi:hypothetical protein